MTPTTRNEISLTRIFRALHELGHEKLWIQLTSCSEAKICHIITWNSLVVAARNLDDQDGGWIITEQATDISPCPAEARPEQFYCELNISKTLTLWPDLMKRLRTKGRQDFPII